MFVARVPYGWAANRHAEDALVEALVHGRPPSGPDDVTVVHVPADRENPETGETEPSWSVSQFDGTVSWSHPDEETGDALGEYGPLPADEVREILEEAIAQQTTKLAKLLTARGVLPEESGKLRSVEDFIGDVESDLLDIASGVRGDVTQARAKRQI